MNGKWASIIRSCISNKIILFSLLFISGYSSAFDPELKELLEFFNQPLSKFILTIFGLTIVFIGFMTQRISYIILGFIGGMVILGFWFFLVLGLVALLILLGYALFKPFSSKTPDQPEMHSSIISQQVTNDVIEIAKNKRKIVVD